MLRHWIYTIRQAILPLLLVIVTTVAFLLIPQAREALFGTVGPEYLSETLQKTTDRSQPYAFFRWRFFWLIAATVWLSLVVWYSARQLVSIDWSDRIPTSAVNHIGMPGMDRPVTHYPRFLGGLTAALLVFAVFNAYNAPSWPHTLASLLIAFLPLLASIAWQLVSDHLRARMIIVVVAVLVNALLIRWKVGEMPIASLWTQWITMFLFSCTSVVVYCFAVGRRKVLKKIRPAAAIREASVQLPSGPAWRKPLAMGVVGILLVTSLGLARVEWIRAIGSCAILLAFLGSALCILTAINLALRGWTKDKPGSISVAILTLLVVVAGLRLQFPEPIGRERLPTPAAAKPAPPPRPAESSADIIVNAYGGGLRAGVYTGQVLASLDDRTCGRFGERLRSLSGVSGGSLGIAVYLTMRQEFVANGGWQNCKPARDNPPKLRKLVELALKQDHLSPVIAQWLTFDLVPGMAPRRGQALLDSWQQAVDYALSRIEAPPDVVSKIGLARPLHELSGGLARPPVVYFNTADARSGMRVWLSNSGRWGDGRTGGVLSPTLQVGQAVLHSARFPLVSPAGYLTLDAERTLVDGGYADNSGAQSLISGARQQAPAAWLNINGNPPDKCGDERAKPSTTWTPVGGLLALRTSQADLAERALRQTCPAGAGAGAAPDGGCIKDAQLEMNLDKAFSPSMPDPVRRCEFVRGLRAAPLGWYMTPATMGDQNITITAAVSDACRVLGKLCDDER
jgi:hypothetical protein